MKIFFNLSQIIEKPKKTLLSSQTKLQAIPKLVKHTISANTGNHALFTPNSIGVLSALPLPLPNKQF